MNPKYEILFTPTKIGSVELKNRFVMCAMESTGIINWLQGMGFNAKLRDLFIERAQDGVGLLIPGTIPLYSVPMHKWLYQNPKAFKGLSELMDEIHGYGSKMFIQLTAGFLLGKAQVGEKVAIIGGGLTGCEIAYELALQGKKPFIVEMVDDIIKVKGVSAANSNCLRDLIKYHEIPVHLETKTLEVKEASIVVEKNGQTEEIPADSVIVSIGYIAGNPFVEK